MILLSIGVVLGLVAVTPGVALLGLVMSPLRRWEPLYILCYASAPLSLGFGLLAQLVLTILGLPPGLTTPGQFSHALPGAMIFGSCAATGGFFSAGVGIMLGNVLRRRMAEMAARRSRR